MYMYMYMCVYMCKYMYIHIWKIRDRYETFDPGVRTGRS